MAKKLSDVVNPDEPTAEAAPKKKYPKVDVLTRRLADPLGSATAVIRLKTPVPTDVAGDTWHTRWIDSSQQGRVFDILENKGWDQVHTSEMVDKRDVAGLAESPDGGYVTRGDKGRELLVKMPESWWRKIHEAKVAVWNGTHQTKKDRRMGIANQVAAAVQQTREQDKPTLVGPDEAGEMVMGLKGAIRHERGPMIDETNAEDFA
jgi:hypothetical protein